MKASKKKNYITPKGHKNLTFELENLVKKESPSILKVISWAASNGDRSENADYIYGKKKLREIDRRIRFLSQRLDDSVVVDPVEIKEMKVQFGATVTVLDNGGEAKTYCIVGVDEIDISNNHISWRSPIGNALLGKSEGDEVIIPAPNGELEYEILSIEYKEIL